MPNKQSCGRLRQRIGRGIELEEKVKDCLCLEAAACEELSIPGGIERFTATGNFGATEQPAKAILGIAYLMWAIDDAIDVVSGNPKGVLLLMTILSCV